MGRVARRLRVMSALALVAGVSAAPAAHAVDPLGCGAQVSTDVTLTADIGPCRGDGLVVTADNVTVNLAGHTIAGLGHDHAVASDTAGVRLVDTSGVTVRDGTVRDFAAGVLITDGTLNTVTGMTATHNIGFGSAMYGAGIDLDGSTHNQITYNVVTGNGPFAGIRMARGASDNHVAYNQVTDNSVLTTEGPDAPTMQDDGISNDTGASRNIIDHNGVARNGEFGISLAGRGANHHRVTFNHITDNGNWGVNAGGDGGHVISENVIDSNRSGGGVVACGTCFGPGDVTTIQRNIISRNNGIGVALIFNGTQFLGGPGIYGTFPAEPYVAPRSNLVQLNVVQGNVGDGIFVECDQVYDADFSSSCLIGAPAHQGLRILNNRAAGNGGVDAGIARWDLHDQSPGCGGNVWKGNASQTANPPCTTAP